MCVCVCVCACVSVSMPVAVCLCVCDIVYRYETVQTSHPAVAASGIYKGLMPLVLYSCRFPFHYVIVHRQSNKVLASNVTTSPGTVNLNNRNDSMIYQQWIFRQLGSYFTLFNRATGLYLDGNGSVSTATVGDMIPMYITYM